MELRLASWRGASAPSRASVHHHANGVTVAGLLGVNPLWASAHTYHSGIDGSGLDGCKFARPAGASLPRGDVEGIGYDPHDNLRADAPLRMFFR